MKLNLSRNVINALHLEFGDGNLADNFVSIQSEIGKYKSSIVRLIEPYNKAILTPGFLGGAVSKTLARSL